MCSSDLAPISAFGVAHGRRPRVSGQRMNEAVPVSTVPLGGAGTLTVMIDGAVAPLSSGRNAGSAGPGSVVVGALVLATAPSAGSSDPRDISNAGMATRVTTAAKINRRRSVVVIMLVRSGYEAIAGNAMRAFAEVIEAKWFTSSPRMSAMNVPTTATLAG